MNKNIRSIITFGVRLVISIVLLLLYYRFIRPSLETKDGYSTPIDTFENNYRPNTGEIDFSK